MGDRHVGHGSFDFLQTKDVFHQLGHFSACQIFDLRGDAFNRTAQIAKTVGALGSFTILIILLAIFQTLDLVTVLLDFPFDSFFFSSEFFNLRVGCIYDVTSFVLDIKRPPTFSVDGLCRDMGFSDLPMGNDLKNRFPLASGQG